MCNGQITDLQADVDITMPNEAISEESGIHTEHVSGANDLQNIELNYCGTFCYLCNMTQSDNILVSINELPFDIQQELEYLFLDYFRIIFDSKEPLCSDCYNKCRNIVDLKRTLIS